MNREDTITKELYKDYSLFKQDLYHNLIALNPAHDSLTLYQKSQKLLDRFLFLFFAEDRQLLQPNTTRLILGDWKDLADREAYAPLYDRFKMYFDFLNKGFKSKRYDVYGYNGGLFRADEVLDGLLITDELLLKHTAKISEYDFASEVDVNILGHIFENSLNELDEIKAKLDGSEVDKTKTKRKKDGVFYTPKYITKYIVDHTVGKLCKEKKDALQINEEEFTADKKRKTKAKQILLDRLKEYRDWLLQITICDPACGSGAFLNQALDFLIAEHQYIDELQAKVLGDSLILSDVEKSILENNLFGVDLNEESVEIAKLSLWLHTARPNRKLNDLNNSIKCGNSLIDDPAVAGEKAFNWQKEFPQVFAKGGFDVVIGNPPYGAKIPIEVQQYLNNKYIKGGSETAISFLKLAHSLLNVDGVLGFIIPKSFSYASNYVEIRNFLNDHLIEIVDCKKVWDEVKLEQVIVRLSKKQAETVFSTSILQDEVVQQVGIIEKETLKEFGFFLNNVSNKEIEIAQKMTKHRLFLNDISKNSRGGIFQKYISDQGDFSVLGGAEIQRYGVVGIKGKVKAEAIKQEANASINENSVLVQNIVAHIENPSDHIKITACLLEKKDFKIVDTVNQITVSKDYSNRFVWILLNSKLINWFAYRFIFAKAVRTMHFDSPVTARIPIVSISLKEQEAFIGIAEKIVSYHQSLQSISEKFQKSIQRKFGIDDLSNKLQDWYLLTYPEFITELAKRKAKLKPADEAEWEEYFLQETKQALSLKHQIDATDKEIDRMVYQLYELTDEEIGVVEG